jgi:hypothetical protein
LKPRRCLDPLDAPSLAKFGETVGKGLDHPLLPGTEYIQVNLGTAETDPARFNFSCFGNDSRDVKECLRRDASYVEACTSGPFPCVNHDNLHAKIGGVKCCGVPPGAGAHDNQFDFASFI